MTRQDIIARVNATVLREFDVEEADLKPEAKLGEDLDLDSLDGIDLVIAIEKEFKEFKVKIKEEQARKLTTMGAIYDYVETLLAGAK